jgi:hypothetical protein
MCGGRAFDEAPVAPAPGRPAASSLAEAVKAAAAEAPGAAPAPRTLQMPPQQPALAGPDAGAPSAFAVPPPGDPPFVGAPQSLQPYPHEPPQPYPHGPPRQAAPAAYPRYAVSGPPHASEPVRVPVTPSLARVVLGGAFFLLGLVAAIAILPRFPGDARGVVGAAAGALGLVALAFILSGVFYRAQAEVTCRQCRRRVLAWKDAFGLICPIAPHHARINWFMVAVTGVFWAGFLIGGIVFAAWVF